MKIILASSSENRKELLHRMGFRFAAVTPDFEEPIQPDMPPQKQIEHFALEKAKSVFPKFSAEENVLILGFDSMIDFEGRSLGKPKTKKAAFEMIQKFIGKSQKVSTGIALIGNWKGEYFEKTTIVDSPVRFRSDITNCQIRRYLEFDDWKGKCGAYSILGTGIFFLESIDGDFQNIIGVPVLKMGEMIREVTGKSPLWILEPQ
ncbi:Maf family protein [Candidatus Gracilibacteria bacterium]|nr:Maf family protein [Candidatus Gracilibacteria bacterium]MCF7819497.1 Maf family protein [Candidatus Gracilibacteria bacterium]